MAIQNGWPWSLLVGYVLLLIKGRILPFDLLSPVDGTEAVSLFPRDLA